MPSKKITGSVDYVGILNPNMRVFDIIMRTDFGTSYNAYVIKGGNKTALVETVHLDFFESYLENIAECCDLKQVDYLIMNHNEPDHSGAIARLLEINPDITVVVSQAGALYLKNITNRSDIKVQVVKDGDTLDLGGGKVLRFINAPFLHWPDSMFTYLEDEKLLFSCDFFGAHFCEPLIWDYKTSYTKSYEEAFKGYYDAIFGPFKPYVVKGLEKTDGLDIDIVCPSHGPVLTKQGRLSYVRDMYRTWSAPQTKTKKSIPIFYCSAYGNTALLADAIAEGVRTVLPDAEVEVLNVIEHDMAQLGAKLNASDAFLLGSPTLNRDAVAPIWILLAHIDAVNIAKRPAAVFGSYGWSGEALANLSDRLKGLKVNLFEQQFKVVFVPTAEDLEKAKAFGQDFAQSLK